VIRIGWTCVALFLAVAGASCEQGVCDASLMGRQLEELPHGEEGAISIGFWGGGDSVTDQDISYVSCNYQCDWQTSAAGCSKCTAGLRATVYELGNPYNFGSYHPRCDEHSGGAGDQICRVWVRNGVVVGVNYICVT
jgi:hypothetical protein